MASSALPKLAPATKTSAHLYETYPRPLKTAPEIQLPRVNPLRPMPPLRRTVALETMIPHYHNEQRAKLMQRREHHRYHNAWGRYYYGSNADKESYRSYVRNVLKQQMADKERNVKEGLNSKIEESENAVKYDRQCLTDDARDAYRKFVYLKGFTAENKKMMEDSWSDRRRIKSLENEHDRELLKYNPINWSCTLK
ncbi:DgyrCDS1886 [Dimorphilus gyrociliatus]|nr:DgyrCDS1886 [Dimorphilus gyrociliatus]